MADRDTALHFRDRKTWLIEVLAIEGWKLKVYGICADGTELQRSTIDAALEHAKVNVAWPKDSAAIGFMTIHFGEEAVWLLVNLWVGDILRHFVFQAPCSEPTRFGSAPDDGTMACVWELGVMIHERNAWIQHVLSRPSNPDFDAYLADSCSVDVSD